MLKKYAEEEPLLRWNSTIRNRESLSGARKLLNGPIGVSSLNLDFVKAVCSAANRHRSIPCSGTINRGPFLIGLTNFVTHLQNG